MAKGDGSITAVKDSEGNPIKGRWRVCLCFGRDPITGKQNRITKIVNGSKAEARRLRDELRTEHENGLKFKGDHITFSKMAELWTRSRYSDGLASDHTIELDAKRLAHIYPYIGALKLKDINVHVLEMAFMNVRETGQINGTTLNKLFALVKRVLNKAVDYDFILRNPCDRMKAPKKNDPQRKALKTEEATSLLKALDECERESLEQLRAKEERRDHRGNAPNRCRVLGLSNLSSIIAVRIGLATGMRRGEVLGLMWKDVDFGDVCELKVRRSYTPALQLKEPKTKAGYRTIALDEETTRHLKSWKSIQEKYLDNLGGKLVQSDNTPVCCTDVGGWYDPTNFSRWWNAFRQKNGFPTLKFHELRHTQATQLLANGVDVKTVQTRMGHANAAITLNWYAHAVPENDQKAAKLIGNLFAGGDQTAESEETESTG